MNCQLGAPRSATIGHFSASNVLQLITHDSDRRDRLLPLPAPTVH